eukprot:3178456-Rhodomonas_salina.1
MQHEQDHSMCDESAARASDNLNGFVSTNLDLRLGPMSDNSESREQSPELSTVQCPRTALPRGHAATTVQSLIVRTRSE